jgi:MerR family transcriptional regulator, light-induced transcriptional regulator
MLPKNRPNQLDSQSGGSEHQDVAFDRPTYNLRAVVQRTGLKPDTLRAWERRYGIPVPDRTEGGHRVYSEADVHCLLWLIARQDEGMNISQAVKLWRTLEKEGRLPLAEESPLPASRATEKRIYEATSGGIIEDLRRGWIDACANFNEREAEQILTQAFSLYPPEIVCLELLQKGLGQIGLEWYRGNYSTQQEHFASALAMRRLETLLTATPDPTHNARVMIACPPDENHTFSPLLLTVLLRRRGWDVVYLGANLPQEEFADAVHAARPDLVVLVAQQLYTAATLLPLARMLAAHRIRVAYGGQIFNMIPALRDHLPAYFLGTDLAGAPVQIERLLLRPPLMPTAQPIPHEYEAALTEFLEKQPQIDAYVWQLMSAQGMPQSHLMAAKHNFGHDLTAALTLGNLNYLGTDLNWIAGLLSYRQISPDVLVHYLNGYYEGARRFLGEPGWILVDWLAHLLQKQDYDESPESDVTDSTGQRTTLPNNSTHRQKLM